MGTLCYKSIGITITRLTLVIWSFPSDQLFSAIISDHLFNVFSGEFHHLQINSSMHDNVTSVFPS